ncbi:MAG: AAA family ATPase, partial [Caldilineales bacterium]
MITELQIKGFKSWQDTGRLRIAPITGLFGVNSSGKTAILQMLLLLKQTIETTDRSRVLFLGDERSYVDLGTFYDILYGHTVPEAIEFDLRWTLPKPLDISDPEGKPGNKLFSAGQLRLASQIEITENDARVNQFYYETTSADVLYRFGMARQNGKNGDRSKQNYELIAEGLTPKRPQGRAWPLPAPVKSYHFPDQVNAYYLNMGFLGSLVLEFEKLFKHLYYLGPLREYPHRSYVWAGDAPEGVGNRGELAIPALLAARERGADIKINKRRKRVSVDERIAQWLRDLGLIEDFRLAPVAPNRKEYEVLVRRSAGSPEVLITGVGFGVSQILPVLTLCYYAPEGSTLVLEQPEIHLHPSVQAGLADVFIDVVKTRGVQIILESHSEHLLRRLQRRMAEEAISPDDTALYFVDAQSGTSHMTPLQI